MVNGNIFAHVFNGVLAQLVQSTTLTGWGSLVRIQYTSRNAQWENKGFSFKRLNSFLCIVLQETVSKLVFILQ